MSDKFIHAMAAVSRALPWLLVVSLSSVGRIAAAQGADPAAADALFQKGREAAEKGEWSVACPKFAESQRLDPAAGTLLNLADCEEHLGRLASAYEHFKMALEMLPAGDDRLAFTKQRIVTIEKVVPHLTLVAPPDFPADARVTRDDVQLGSASFGLALPVNPGQHTIVVTAPGHAEKRTSLSLRASEGETVTLRVGEVLPSAPAPMPISHPGEVAARPDGGGGARTAGYVVGAFGLAGVGVGAITGLLVLGKKSIVDDPSHCDPTTHVCDATGLAAASSGKTLSTASTVAFVAGGALLVTGIVLVLTGGNGAGGPNASTATLLGPEMYGGGGAGLRVIHAF